MSSIECPLSIMKCAVYVFGFVSWFVLSQYQHMRFYMLFAVGGGLSHKSFDSPGMILGQHGWYRIPLGREVKQSEVIRLRGYLSIAIVNGGMLVV